MAKNKNKAKSAPANDKTSAEKPEKQHETAMEFIASMATVLVSGLFIITFILQAFEIPSGSMKDTLLIGDHLFVDRVSLAPKTKWMGKLLPYGQIHRGDVIVFISPAQPGLYLVKRVRGLPGDKIHLKDGKLYVNGELQNEPFARYMYDENTARYDPYRDNFPSVSIDTVGGIPDYWRLTMASHVQDGEFVVPPDHYFAMGDNRYNSFDSRYFGPVPKENLIGRPMFIYWSFDTPEDQYPRPDNQIGFETRVKNIAYTIFHFPTKTRWNRTLNMVH